MDLGAFSVSLTVRDLDASKAFYENLGFTVFGGNPEQKWLILKNGDVVIGLFVGMFERNMLTFNPGWDANASALESFTDIRDVQRWLKARGVELLTEVDESGSGPGSFLILDPDGNPVLFDQHV
ncbi:MULTISPECIES: VOC family protein [unclassified Streptomyces]|uniref:VOC family protein n=1 Tax=unclassified Streptomyces TaxID=2593676 RepID=UPI003813822F